MREYTINEPVAFEGTDEEKAANRKTHAWSMVDDCDVRCMYCDCKMWHKAADYPCGEEPPRQNVTYRAES